MLTLKLKTGTLLRDEAMRLLLRIDARHILGGYNCVSFQYDDVPPRKILHRLREVGGWFDLTDLRPTRDQSINLHFAAMDFGLPGDANSWGLSAIHRFDTLVLDADLCAESAHTGQKRKHSGEPYIIHPRAVAQFLLGAGVRDSRVIAGALLHDVIEDTPLTKRDLLIRFGDGIADLVDECTMVSKKSDGNREVRKKLDLEHYAKGSPEAQTIKLADFIHNAPNLFFTEPDFFPTFIKEKSLLVSKLDRADPVVRDCAIATVIFYSSAMIL